MADGPFLLSEEEQEEENRRQMEALAASQQAALTGKPAPKAPRPAAPRPVFNRSAFATGANPMMDHGQSGAYHAAIGAAQQGQALGNMVSQTMNAWQDEHDSRVAQEREMRRMEHEKELKRMELEALIARLEAARRPVGPVPKAAFRGGVIY